MKKRDRPEEKAWLKSNKYDEYCNCGDSHILEAMKKTWIDGYLAGKIDADNG